MHRLASSAGAIQLVEMEVEEENCTSTCVSGMRRVESTTGAAIMRLRPQTTCGARPKALDESVQSLGCRVCLRRPAQLCTSAPIAASWIIVLCFTGFLPVVVHPLAFHVCIHFVRQSILYCESVTIVHCSPWTISSAFRIASSSASWFDGCKFTASEKFLGSPSPNHTA